MIAKIPRIVSIIEKKPFSLLLRFDNNELRLMKFDSKEVEKNDLEKQILDENMFLKVSLTERGAVCWKDISYINALGKTDFLKLDTLQIYKESKLIKENVISIDITKEFTQAKYAQIYGLKIMDVMNKVRRGQLKTRFISDLGLRLIVID